MHFDPRCFSKIFLGVHYPMALLLLCFLIVGIHASGISISILSMLLQ